MVTARLARHVAAGMLMVLAVIGPCRGQAQPGAEDRPVVVVHRPEITGAFWGRGANTEAWVQSVLKEEFHKKGFIVRTATSGRDARDLHEHQRELELENSEWGRRGRGRKPIGFFRGADYVVTARIHVRSLGHSAVQSFVPRGTVVVLHREVLSVEVSLTVTDALEATQVWSENASAKATLSRRSAVYTRWGNASHSDRSDAISLAAQKSLRKAAREIRLLRLASQ